MPRMLIHRYPGRAILGALFLTITLGTLALALPFCQTTPIGWLDLFFTSISATTVTGLLTTPVTNFTMFGQFIILLLIQIGGLGLITMLLFFISLFMDIGLTTQLMAGEILEVESIKNIRRIIKFIIGATLGFESVGAIITLIAIRDLYPLKEAIFKSIFHSVSSFCNAGISLFPNSMSAFTHNPLMLLTTSFLAFFGGLGFLVLYHLVHYFFWPKQPRKVNLHTRIVLLSTFYIVIISWILFWILEHNNTLIDMSLPYQWLNSFFNVMCMRSTGYLSVSFNNLQLATIFLIMFVGFIGSSPGSTGSGIKTTTLVILLATAKAIIMGQDFVHIKQRKIKKSQVYRAITILMIAQAWIVITTFFLLITEKNLSFLDTLFETVSSFSVLGIPSGITPLLSTIGKLFIMASMMIGRIGTLTLVLAFANTADEKDFSYPEERVMLS